MKKALSCLIFLTSSLVLAVADDPTTLQVAPSDQVKYPDASQVLNKTDAPPKPSAGISTQPLLVPTPAPATPQIGPQVATSIVKAPPVASGAQWFLKWSVSGDEAGVRSWAQALNRGATVRKVNDGLWEVWAGPFDAAQLKDALAGQEGLATLVKK